MTTDERKSPKGSLLASNLLTLLGCAAGMVFSVFLSEEPYTGLAVLWLPAGVLVAAAILHGTRPAPGAATALFLGGWWLFESIWIGLGMAVGGVFTILLTHWLIVVRNGFAISLERIRDFRRLVLQGAVIGTIPLTCLTSAGYLLSGAEGLPPTGRLLLNWWMGDILGVLIVAPAILVWFTATGLRATFSSRRAVEAIVLALILALISWTATSGAGGPQIAYYPFAIFPFVVWTAVRFGVRGATLATLLVTVIILFEMTGHWGWFPGHVGLVAAMDPMSEFMLQIFLGAVALTGLLLSSVIGERRLTEKTLETSEARYRSLFDFHPQPLVLYDPKTLRVFEFNSAAASIYGSESERWNEGLLTTLSAADDTDWFEYLKPGGKTVWQGRHRRSDGEIIEVMATRQGIAFQDSNVQLLAIEDITDSLRAHDALLNSEQKLSLHLQQNALGYIEFDRTHRVQLWNRTAEMIFGFKAEEITGKTADLLVPMDIRENIHELFEMLFEQRGGTSSTNANLHKDGRELTCEWFNTPLLDRNGSVIGVASLVHDITERDSALRELKRSEEKFRTVIEASPLGIHIFEWRNGRDLILVGANSAANRALGFEDEEVLGKSIEEAFPTLKDTEIPAHFRDVARGGAAWSADQVSYVDDQLAGAFELTAFRTAGGLVVSMLLDVTERRRAEEALRLREQAMEATTQGIIIFRNTRAGLLQATYTNPATTQITGYAENELKGNDWDFLVGAETGAEEVEIVRRALLEGRSMATELLAYRKDGIAFHAGLAISPIRHEEHRITHFVAVLTDLDPMKRLEAQFRQSQKMEAIGRLAGGVAHDFNNLLTAIIGYNDLILSGVSPESLEAENAGEIQKAAERAAALTGQLLAFSRQQTLLPQLVDVNKVVEGVQKMLLRLIGDTITVRSELTPRLGRVKVEPGQLEQVLLNLAINARDAMRDGGTLTIHTGSVTISEALADRSNDMVSGSYVLLSIADTGAGMTQDVKEHLFEPFFTTKEKGKGTGLGLATSYGIIKQSGGHIRVQSDLGRGSVFEVYLPIVEGATESSPSKIETVAQMVGGSEKIIVVEDDIAVRPLTVNILKSLGYNVIEAQDGHEATQIIESLPTWDLDLVITDVVMPKMGGKELGEWLRRHHPELPVLYTSGYIETPLGEMDADRDENFLQKPFTPRKLAERVRCMLRGRASRT